MTRMHLVPALVVAGLAVATAASAQSRGWIDSSRVGYADERQSYNDSRRAAYDNGFREGVKEGEKDGRRGDGFAYRDERDFQRADRGYHRSLGSVERYREVFRTGYAAGYADGYRRYDRVGNRGNGRGNGRWSTGPGSGGQYPGGSGSQYPGGYGGQYPGRGGYYSPAFDNGVKDGFEKGVEDARKNRSFDVLRHKWYREGDRHYDNDYGPREQYKDVYRQGFKDGYARGFRDGRYR